jgi:ATP-dependent exoDNAse (exonuclease V) alpha subunit
MANTDITLSGEQKALLQIMENTKKHLFITGRAGAGKSVLLRHFRENTSKRVVVAAPTGIAALNAKGQTLHSLFKLPGQLYRGEGTLYPNPKLSTLLKRIDTLVIDEISMVRADLLDAVDQRLRDAHGTDEPFGGIQVIMFGDCYQLPPVVEKKLTEYFEAVHGGYYFFNARAWQKTEFKVFELSQVFRQKDPIFKDVLNAVRDGSVVEEQIEQLNARHGIVTPADGTVTLAPTNSLVTEINQRKLNQLPGKLFTYRAEVTGEMKQSAFPTEEILNLKEGAQIVLLKNDMNGRWVNGTVGKIAKLAEDAITVEVNGISYLLEKATWEEIVYEYNSATKKVEIHTASSFTQFPLRLAWALTIHKSQGQTYESVALDLTTATFAHGQLYVALSRCTSLEGLYLKMAVKKKDVIVDPKVAEFMARVEAITVDEAQEAAPVIETPANVAPETAIQEVAVALVEPPPVAVESELVELVIATPAAATVKMVEIPATADAPYTLTNLPMRQKGGRKAGGEGNRSEKSIGVSFNWTPGTVAKLNALAEQNPDLDKSALSEAALAWWFKSQGL